MKKITLLMMLAVVMTSCWKDEPYKPDPAIHYINVDCKIVEFGQQSDHAKFSYKMVLVRLLSDTTMVMELSQDGIGFTDGQYYNWQKGDTVHFDYVLKRHFFKLTKPITHN